MKWKIRIGDKSSMLPLRRVVFKTLNWLRIPVSREEEGQEAGRELRATPTTQPYVRLVGVAASRFVRESDATGMRE